MSLHNAARSAPREQERMTAAEYRAKPPRRRRAKAVSLRQFIPNAETVRVELPIPPSINNVWANIPGKGRVRSQDYRRWHKLAFDELCLQKPGKIGGKFAVVISLGRIGRRADCDNRIKPLLDLLKDEVIEDDVLCERVSCGWSDTVKPERVVVEIHKVIP